MAVNLNSKIAVEEGHVRVGNPIWLTLTVENQTSSSVSVVNPDVGIPSEAMHWSFSDETYKISVLLSFHLMFISMTDPSGENLPMVGPNPWATPTLMPRLQLVPGGHLKLRITLDTHFKLRHAGRYRLIVHYGDEQAFAHAGTELLID